MTVRGLTQVLRKLDTFSSIIKEDVKDTVEDYTLKIQREAIDLAPVAGQSVQTTYGSQKINTGINQFIGSEIIRGGFAGKVFIEARASKLAIYLEFGTGLSAAGYVPTLPPEFQSIARRYYINGKGTLIKHPFLLPAYFNNKFKFIYELQRVLKSHGIETVYIP